MFPTSLYFLFAVKPAGAMELPEVEESQTNQIPQEVPSLGKRM